jgi:hypothetical protein
MLFWRTEEAMDMTRKWLRFGFYVLAISLLFLTLSSCAVMRRVPWGSPGEEFAAEETVEAQHLATEAAATVEAATAIAGVETYEAGATAEAEATANAEAVSIGVCRTPGAWCVVEGEFDVVVPYSLHSNKVNISFPVDGGPVSGDLVLAYVYDASDREGNVCRAAIGFDATLSGYFDPEDARLEGSVDDVANTREDLEGCEEFEFDAWALSSWWATYDSATGILTGEVVSAEGVMPFDGTTVSEEPSNPAD